MINGFIILILLICVVCVLLFLYKADLLRRRVMVTIVENLPIGIFKENNDDKANEVSSLKNVTYTKSIFDLEKAGIDKIENSDKDFNSINANVDASEEEIKRNDLVYWTPRGRSYHKTSTCLSLCRSKIINSGTIEESQKESICDRCK